MRNSDWCIKARKGFNSVCTFIFWLVEEDDKVRLPYEQFFPKRVKVKSSGGLAITPSQSFFLNGLVGKSEVLK